MTLRRKLILVYSIAFSLILVIFGTVVTLYYARLAEKENYANCGRIVATNAVLVEQYFDQLRTIARLIANDRDIILALENRNAAKSIDYAAELNNQRQLAEKIQELDILGILSNAIVIGPDFKPLYHYKLAPVRDFDFSGCAWFTSRVAALDAGAVFTHAHSTEYLLNDKGGSTISLIAPIRSPGQYLGGAAAYLLFDFDFGFILTQYARESFEWTAVYDGIDPVYFPENLKLTQRQNQLFMVRLAAGDESFHIPARGADEKAYLVFTRPSIIAGWRIAGFAIMENILTPIIIFAVILILLAVAVVVVLAAILSKSVLLPLHQLIDKYREIGEGNFGVTFSETGMVELDELMHTSRQMVKSISRLTGDIADEQKKLALEQVKTLQRQINPHFLTSVLQSIKALASRGDVNSISFIATLLDKVIAYSVDNPYETVDLQNELLHVNDYIKIQNICYGGLIQYDLVCDKIYYNVSIPKLIIQPVVENSFTHGIQNNVSFSITIKVYESDGTLTIEIRDDGAGMIHSAINDLNAKLVRNESPGTGGKVGLLNVNRRIKNVFGTDYGLSVKSLPRGLSVMIRLPRG